MKIAIVGTKGIPDLCRGFEKAAQFIALGLVQTGHEVHVYCSHNHSFQGSNWQGIKLIHIHDPEYNLGAIGKLLYDLNCYKNLRHHQFDLIMQFGPSSAIWSWMLPKQTLLVTNIYSLEWKRGRYGIVTSKILQIAEWLAVRYSHSLISDSLFITKNLQGRYKKEVTLIPQGIEPFSASTDDSLSDHQLIPFHYNLYVGSLDADCDLETILDGVVSSDCKKPFVIVGNCSGDFAENLKQKYSHHRQVKFLGSFYEPERLNQLRYYSDLYFCGNRSDGSMHLLLEAMAAGCAICALDNESNRSILGDDALYFSYSRDVAGHLISGKVKKINYKEMIVRNLDKIYENHNWPTVINKYRQHFASLFPLVKFKVNQEEVLPLYQIDEC